jgi:AcrR family transcriptional regulator
VAGAVVVLVVEVALDVLGAAALDVLGAAAAAVEVDELVELELDLEPLLPQLAMESAMTSTARPGTAVTAKPPTKPFFIFPSREVQCNIGVATTGSYLRGGRRTITSVSGGGRGELTRESILRAALVEMAASSTVDMATIAHRADVDRSTIYRYFASREGLMRELSERSIAEVGQSIADAGIEDAPFEIALHRFMRAILDVGDRYAVLVHEEVAPTEAQLDPLVRVPLRRLLERGRNEGILRDDIDPEWVFVALWRLIGPWLRYSVYAVDPDAAVFGLVDLFLRGARSRGVTEPADQPAAARTEVA